MNIITSIGKVEYVQKFTPLDAIFWTSLGLNQTLDYLTYIAIIAIIVL